MEIGNIENQLSNIIDLLDGFNNIYNTYDDFINSRNLNINKKKQFIELYLKQSNELLKLKLCEAENLIEESYKTYQNFILENYYEPINNIIDRQPNEDSIVEQKHNLAIKKAAFMTLYTVMANDPNSYLNQKPILEQIDENLEAEIQNLNQL